MATIATTYPKISRKSWFLLRDRLKQSIPSAITPTLIISLSHMEEGSARSNVISPLRELGLIDDDNKPTALAQRWRHDDEYATVCHEIRAKVYPSDLVEAFPNADASKKESIKKWFMKVGQVGEMAAKMYSDTYIMLSQADLAPPEKTPSKASPRKATARPTVKLKTPTAMPDIKIETHQPPAPPQLTELPTRRLPAIHIDVQVHISPDTSAEQIDRIFESMAKHLGEYIK